MKYLKIINLLDNEITQTCKFKTKNRVEINDKHMERITPMVKLNLKLQC